MVEITKDNFKMNGITEKDWAKIFLHLQVHQKGIEIVRSNDIGITMELKPKYIITYIIKKQEIFVSSHYKNIKSLKEMLYHYLNCSCKIDDTINNTDTFEEALTQLGIKKK